MHVQPLDEVDLGRDRDIEVSHVQVHDIVDLLAFDIIDVHARPRTRVEQFGLHGEESPHPVASEDAAVGAHQRIAALFFGHVGHIQPHGYSVIPPFVGTVGIVVILRTGDSRRQQYGGQKHDFFHFLVFIRGFGR